MLFGNIEKEVDHADEEYTGKNNVSRSSSLQPIEEVTIPIKSISLTLAAPTAANSSPAHEAKIRMKTEDISSSNARYAEDVKPELLYPKSSFKEDGLCILSSACPESPKAGSRADNLNTNATEGKGAVKVDSSQDCTSTCQEVTNCNAELRLSSVDTVKDKEDKESGKLKEDSLFSGEHDASLDNTKERADVAIGSAERGPSLLNPASEELVEPEQAETGDRALIEDIQEHGLLGEIDSLTQQASSKTLVSVSNEIKAQLTSHVLRS